jgi:hypothetical protein
MAHCPYEKLRDVQEILAELRTWDEMREPRPGVFYLRRTPFLHFHTDRSGRRWADVRDGADWGSELDLPFESPALVRTRFLREVRRRHRALLSAT